MSDSNKKRVRRTLQERMCDIDLKIEELEQQLQVIDEKKQEAVAVFDAKIAKVEGKISALNKKKSAMLSPKPPRKPRKTKKQKIQDLMKQAQKAGLKPEEIAQRLGLSVEK